MAYGQVMAGRVLLVVAWLFGMLGVFSVKSIRDRWRWGALAAIFLGGALWVTDYLVGRSAISASPAVTQSRRPHAVVAENRDSPPPPPQEREKPTRGRSVETAVPTPKAASKPTVVSPSASQRAPLIPSGVKVTQKNVSGPNVIAGGDVTINPEVNPYAPVVTYEFNGFKHVSRPAAGEFTAESGESEAFRKIMSLNEARNWKALAELCETEIRTTPEWLTPYLFAGVAYANLGDLEKATERLEHFNKHANGVPDYAGSYAESTRLLEQLRGQAKPSAPEN